MALLFLDKSGAAYSVGCSSELSGGGELSFFLELPLSQSAGTEYLSSLGVSCAVLVSRGVLER